MCNLDSQAAARLISTAVEERAVVRLWADHNSGGVTSFAACIGVSDSHLILRLKHADTRKCTILGLAALRLCVDVGGARYLFETGPAETGFGEDPAVIRVSRPITIAPMDRRRSQRRRLREPADVVLNAVGEHEGWRCGAVLLNVSPDGIACRIPQQDGRLPSLGDTLRAEFSLDGSPFSYALTGRVVNVTQGGTPGHLVMGLEFVIDSESEAVRTRLR